MWGGRGELADREQVAADVYFHVFILMLLFTEVAAPSSAPRTVMKRVGVFLRGSCRSHSHSELKHHSSELHQLRGYCCFGWRGLRLLQMLNSISVLWLHNKLINNSYFLMFYALVPVSVFKYKYSFWNLCVRYFTKSGGCLCVSQVASDFSVLWFLSVPGLLSADVSDDPLWFQCVLLYLTRGMITLMAGLRGGWGCLACGIDWQPSSSCEAVRPHITTPGSLSDTSCFVLWMAPMGGVTNNPGYSRQP